MPVNSHVVTRVWLGSNAACWLFGQNWYSEIAHFAVCHVKIMGLAETLVLEKIPKHPKSKKSVAIVRGIYACILCILALNAGS